jgi:hypothetical protein
MNVRELITELEAVNARIGPDVPVYLAIGNAEADSFTVEEADDGSIVLEGDN